MIFTWGPTWNGHDRYNPDLGTKIIILNISTSVSGVLFYLSHLHIKYNNVYKFLFVWVLHTVRTNRNHIVARPIRNIQIRFGFDCFYKYLSGTKTIAFRCIMPLNADFKFEANADFDYSFILIYLLYQNWESFDLLSFQASDLLIYKRFLETSRADYKPFSGFQKRSCNWKIYIHYQQCILYTCNIWHSEGAGHTHFIMLLINLPELQNYFFLCACINFQSVFHM